MTKFFFHVRNDEVLFEDRRGGEFTDLPAAWNWAVADARTMIQDGQLEGPLDKQWMEICDGAGKIVASLPFLRVAHLH